jgi:DNA-binding NtrC family response regulator
VPHPRRLVGRSPAFLALLDALRRAAGHELPVLLVGEPGTGKRLAAETLRELGERRRGPLVRLDATGLAEPAGAARPSSPTSTLAAWSDHLAAARGGTLVVHEIGDLPRPLQADLSERLGRFEHREPSRDTDPGDFRLVATTSAEATALVRSGALLGELHQRLALATIRVPALRERMEDLPLLVDSLLERIADGAPIEIAPEARELLAGFRYPGNVAELLRLLERAVLIADGTTLRPEHLRDARTPCASLPEAPRPGDSILPLAEVERRYLLWALETFHGSRGELAEKLGVAERTLFRKLRELKSRAPAGAA